MASRHSSNEAILRNDEKLRIVMVGKTGIGKSSTGNTILGRRCFESKFSARSITDKCLKEEAEVDGQKVAVIDTPGLFDTRRTQDKTHEDIKQCICYSSPGPHVFLFVVRLGRFTEEEKQSVQKIREIFGQDAGKYSMVLFTHGDLLKDTSIEEFMEDSPDLQGLVSRCNGQYHVFNNELENRSQVTELLKKIRTIVQKNGGSHYTNEMFQKAERAIEEEKQRILKEKEEQIRKEKEEQIRKWMKELEEKLRAEYEEKIKNITEKFQYEIEKERRERKRLQDDFTCMKRESEMCKLNSNMEKLKLDLERKKLYLDWEALETRRMEEERKEERQREMERQIKAEQERVLKEQIKQFEEEHERMAREKAEKKTKCPIL